MHGGENLTGGYPKTHRDADVGGNRFPRFHPRTKAPLANGIQRRLLELRSRRILDPWFGHVPGFIQHKNQRDRAFDFGLAEIRWIHRRGLRDRFWFLLQLGDVEGFVLDGLGRRERTDFSEARESASCPRCNVEISRDLNLLLRCFGKLRFRRGLLGVSVWGGGAWSWSSAGGGNSAELALRSSRVRPGFAMIWVKGRTQNRVAVTPTAMTKEIAGAAELVSVW